MREPSCRRESLRRVAVLLTAITLLAAACGKDDAPPAASGDPNTTSTAAGGDDGAGTIELVGKDIAFDRTELTAPAGSVTITFDNQDEGTPHNLHVTGGGVDEKTDIEPGPATQTLQVDLEPGAYTYVCDVHPQQMTGDLEVT